MSNDANPSDFQTTDNSNLLGDSPQNHPIPKQFFDIEHESSVIRDKQLPNLVDPKVSPKKPVYSIPSSEIDISSQDLFSSNNQRESIVEGDDSEAKIQHFLDSLQGPEFGFTLPEDTILNGIDFCQNLEKLRAISSDLFSLCSIKQKRKLLNGMIEFVPFLVYQYFSYSEKCRNAFYEAIEGVISLINLLSNMCEDQIDFDTDKLITLALIKQERNFFPEAQNNDKILEEYEANVVNRVINLYNTQKSSLNVHECKEIVSYLDDQPTIKWSTLQDFYVNGVSSMLILFEINDYINLENSIEFLKQIEENIEVLKQDNSVRLLCYVAVLYSLSHLDSLHFPLGIFDAFDESEMQKRKQMQILAENIYSRF